VRRVYRNVKRWRNAAMALRWTAAGMMEAAKGFRRLKAYKYCPFSELRLQLISPSTSPSELNTTLTSHSIIHGDACFAYFSKIWGILLSENMNKVKNFRSDEKSFKVPVIKAVEQVLGKSN
jgi:hypothetical protein